MRFRHELTRRVVAEALFVPRRHALHRRLLAVLGAAPGRGPGPARPPRAVGRRTAGDPAPRGAPPGSARPTPAPTARPPRSSAPRWNTPGCSTRAERAALLEMFAMEAHLTDRTRESLRPSRRRRGCGGRSATQRARRARASPAQAEVQWRSGDRRAAGKARARPRSGVWRPSRPGPELAMAYGMLGGPLQHVRRLRRRPGVGRARRGLARQLGDDAALAFALIQVGVATVEDDLEAGAPRCCSPPTGSPTARAATTSPRWPHVHARAWVYRFRQDQAEPRSRRRWSTPTPTRWRPTGITCSRYAPRTSSTSATGTPPSRTPAWCCGRASSRASSPSRR